MTNDVLRIDLTVELTEEQRRDIAMMAGEEGTADEEMCRSFLQAAVQTTQLIAALKRLHDDERRWRSASDPRSSGRRS